MSRISPFDLPTDVELVADEDLRPNGVASLAPYVIFWSIDDVVRQLETWAKEKPEMVELKEVARTPSTYPVGGNLPIIVLTVGAKSATKTILFTSATHGCDVHTVNINLLYFDWLIHSTESRAETLRNTTRASCIFVVNPSGYVHDNAQTVRTDDVDYPISNMEGSHISKNCNFDPSTTPTDNWTDSGVNLDRNNGFICQLTEDLRYTGDKLIPSQWTQSSKLSQDGYWGYKERDGDDNNNSSNPLGPFYKGTGPNSEIETRALQRVFQEVKPVVSIHHQGCGNELSRINYWFDEDTGDRGPSTISSEDRPIIDEVAKHIVSDEFVTYVDEERPTQESAAQWCYTAGQMLQVHGEGKKTGCISFTAKIGESYYPWTGEMLFVLLDGWDVNFRAHEAVATKFANVKDEDTQDPITWMDQFCCC